MQETITITWDGTPSGRSVLVGKVNNVRVASMPGNPIDARTDSHTIAEAFAELRGGSVVSVDHDRGFIHATIER